VHVIHGKFAAYLRPVLERLDVPWAYLMATNRELQPCLEAQGLPCLDAVDGRVHRPAPPGLRGMPEIAAWYDEIYETCRRSRPRCVVLVEGNAPQDEVVNRACARLGIPTVCVQHGWSPFVHNGFRNMSYTSMVVWGRGFAELLRPYNPVQSFDVMGHPQVPATAPAAAGRTRRPAAGFFLQAPGRLITSAVWDIFLRLIAEQADACPGTDVLVREHPTWPLGGVVREALQRRPNVRVIPPDAEPLSGMLSRIDVAVSIYSTVILESIAAGVVPVVVNLTSMPSYHPDVAGAGAGIEVRSVPEGLAAIRRVLIDREYRNGFDVPLATFRERYFDGRPDAAGRIAEHIAAHAASAIR
jgi:hypothetical protein